MARYRIQVKGIVQGVGFRYYTQRLAQKTEINGFVRNQSDGSVYIEAEGNEDSLSSFMDGVRNGPPRAMVRHLKKEVIPENGEPDFRIQ